MKKTILSLAVSMASFGAFASTTSHDVASQAQDNFAVFGKVGVFYDHVEGPTADVLGIEDRNKVDYKRNTEIGIETGALVAGDLLATGVVVGNFQGEDEGFQLDKLEVGLQHKYVGAHFGKIDDRFDVAVKQFDQFSDVFSGHAAAERFSAVGKVEGVALSASPIVGLDLGVQVGEKTLSTFDGTMWDEKVRDEVALTAAYEAMGVDLAVAYKSTDRESGEKQDAEKYAFGAGYGYGDAYFGLIYAEGEDHDGMSAESFNATASYMYGAATFTAGYGLDQMDGFYDVETLRLAAKYDLGSGVEMHAGYGKAWSDATAKDDEIATAGVIVRF